MNLQQIRKFYEFATNSKILHIISSILFIYLDIRLKIRWIYSDYLFYYLFYLRPATLDPDKRVLLWILRIFKKNLFTEHLWWLILYIHETSPSVTFFSSYISSRFSKRDFTFNISKIIIYMNIKSIFLFGIHSIQGWTATTRHGVRSSKNLVCFVFFKHPFWDSPFALLPTSYKKKHQLATFRR